MTVTHGLLLIAAGVWARSLWYLYWRWHRWSRAWRVKAEADNNKGVIIHLVRGRGYYSDIIKIGQPLQPDDDNFFEALHELRAKAEERASELNQLDEEMKVK